MTAASIRIADWDTLCDDARMVRLAVFVVEQQVPIELEWDENDAACWHAVAYDGNGTPVGTGRLLPDGHIGRMAVLKAWRGTGIGSAILRGLMDKAEALGYGDLLLNAQTDAVPFYSRHGFVTEGPEFMEAGIPHRAMRRRQPR